MKNHQVFSVIRWDVKELVPCCEHDMEKKLTEKKCPTLQSTNKHLDNIWERVSKAKNNCSESLRENSTQVFYLLNATTSTMHGIQSCTNQDDVLL